MRPWSRMHHICGDCDRFVNRGAPPLPPPSRTNWTRLVPPTGQARVEELRARDAQLAEAGAALDEARREAGRQRSAAQIAQGQLEQAQREREEMQAQHAGALDKAWRQGAAAAQQEAAQGVRLPVLLPHLALSES